MQDLDFLRSQVETEIRDTLKGGGTPSPLANMYNYHMGFCDENGTPATLQKGKYMRPTLCLLMCQALGGDVQKALPVAAGLELIHKTSLIFDDIQDKASRRNGRLTVNSVWGDGQSINAGLALSCLARLAIHRGLSRGIPTGKILESLESLEKAVMQLCYGQYLDLDFLSRKTVQLGDYLEMIEAKTGALFGAACQMGAMSASIDKELAPGVIIKSRELGLAMGCAFQMQDDYLGVWGDEGEVGKTANDLMEKKRSLPVVLAMTDFPNEVIVPMKTVTYWLNADYISRSEAMVMKAWMEGKGIPQRINVLKNSYILKAQQLMDKLPLSSRAEEILEGLLNSVIERSV